MFGGYGGYGRKRSRGDWNHCDQCGDGFDMEEDEWVTCCHCECCLCESCMSELTCKGCEEAEARGEMVIGTAMCESCCEFCDACGQEDEPAAYCTHCIKEHRTKCSSKTRAERVMASVNQEIADTEEAVMRTRREIATAQAKLARLEADLTRARKKKADAEVELGMNAPALAPAPAPAPAPSSRANGKAPAAASKTTTMELVPASRSSSRRSKK